MAGWGWGVYFLKSLLQVITHTTSISMVKFCWNAIFSWRSYFVKPHNTHIIKLDIPCYKNLSPTPTQALGRSWWVSNYHKNVSKRLVSKSCHLVLERYTYYNTTTVNALYHFLNAKCKTKWCWVGNLDAFWGHNGGFPFHPPIFLSPEL